MSSNNVSFSLQAYSKIIFHATKYPHCAINGILLSSRLAKEKNEVVDAIPLFHIALNLTPMAEIALMQIDEIVTKRGLTICGYYTAPENSKECSFERAYHKILDKLAANSTQPLLVVLDNNKLDPESNNAIPLKIAQYSEGNFRPIDSSKVSVLPSGKQAMDLCNKLVMNGTYQSLVDFDNHLDDISLDWMNPEINKDINNVLSSVY